MARRANFFERIIDDYSSDRATGTRSDRTTPRLTAEVETPREVDDDRSFGADQFHYDGYASDASYVTVDEDLEATMTNARRDADVDLHLEAVPRDENSMRATDRKYDDEYGGRQRRKGESASNRLRADDSLRRDQGETDVKAIMRTRIDDEVVERSNRPSRKRDEVDEFYHGERVEATPRRRRLAGGRTDRVDFGDGRHVDADLL